MAELEKQYDVDYQKIINQLNDEFQKNQNSTQSTESAFVDILPDQNMILEKLPKSELIKIRRKLQSNVEEIDLLTQDEKDLLNKINESESHHYKTVVLKLTGEIDTKKIMKNYAEYIRRNKAFRTVYFHKGMQNPVKVIYESSNASFPICNIQKYDDKKQKALMVNILAAQSRREYDIEKDGICNLCGYIIKSYELLVVISLCPKSRDHIDVIGMIREIFADLKTKGENIKMVTEEALDRMNEQLNEKNVNYWKTIFGPSPKHLQLPCEKSGEYALGKTYYEKVVSYKEVGEELTDKIDSFCQNNGISVKSLFLYAWADLLGKYNHENEAVLALAQSGTEMKIIPVRILCDNDKITGCKQIDRQLELAVKYGECDVADVERGTGIQFDEYVSMVQNFTGFLNPEDSGENDMSFREIDFIQPSDTKINLFVNYQLLESGIMITYTSKNGIFEFVLDKLHELLMDEVTALLSNENVAAKKAIFIHVDDTEEEKLHKITRAQIALCLKNSGIFDAITIEEIIKLAEYCSIRTCLTGDTVLNENTRPDKLYIVSDGKLEESRMALDGMVKSIRIVKNGAIFGQESLFDCKEAGSTYTVVSSQAKIVEMDKDIMVEVLRRKPEGWIALLEKEYDQKCRLQRLWTLD